MEPTPKRTRAATEPAQSHKDWLVRMLACVDEELANDEWLRESPMLSCELVEFHDYLLDELEETPSDSL